MKIEILYKAYSMLTVEVVNNDKYESKNLKYVFVDGKKVLETRKNIFSISGLKPGNKYDLEIKFNGDVWKGSVETIPCDYIFNVRRFGAVGDGVTDDTLAIQTAINAAPKNGVIYIPEGSYKVTTLFLKSNTTLDLQKGATIVGTEDINKLGILPGVIDSVDQEDEMYLGSWEGNPLDIFTSIITGVDVENVNIIGDGTIDGGATFKPEGWWRNDRNKRRAYRPKLLNLIRCKNINLVGLKIENSPSWTLHPIFSEKLKFIDLEITNPKHAQNTDGLDPESCKGVDILGVKFSVGDDCIALKSGKIYLGNKLKKPTENVVIRNCYMMYGHGAVVLGSEMAGGVKNISVEKCLFYKTDKGLRVKTRRGRGKDGSIDGFYAKDINMDGVKIPFVVNSFYHCCDPDGKTEYVYSKEELPVDERTPEVRNIIFEGIEAINCEVGAGFIYGLPEMKIENLTLKDIEVDFSKDPTPDYPAMMCHLEKRSKGGLFVGNAKNFKLENFNVKNAAGKEIQTINTD